MRDGLGNTLWGGEMRAHAVVLATLGDPGFNADGRVNEARNAGASWSSASRASASWASASWASASWASSAGALALVNNASLDTAGDG